jgi:SHS family lactate transporter-like MFS transporter
MSEIDKPHAQHVVPAEVQHEEEHMSVGRYIATRIPTLKPPMEKAPNPFKLLALLNLQQWMFFLVAFFAWSWDAFDFFTVSLTVADLAETFDKSTKDVSSTKFQLQD